MRSLGSRPREGSDLGYPRLEGSGPLGSGTGYPLRGPKGHSHGYTGYGDLQEVGPGSRRTDDGLVVSRV